MKLEEIAKIFHNIIKETQNVEIDGEIMQSKSINLRLDEDDTIPEFPFLFVTGDIVT